MVVEPHSDAAAAPLVVDAVLRRRAGRLPFTISGWAVSGAARQIREVSSSTRIRPTGRRRCLSGRPASRGRRPAHAAAPFGGQFARDGFSVDVTGLTPGSYDLLVVGRSRLSSALDAAVWVGPITVR